MATLSLRLPESIHQKLGELAEAEGISINALINSAVAEKLAALMTEEYLARRGTRARKRKVDALLAKIPATPPVAGDELPEGYGVARPKSNRRLRVTRPRARRSAR